MSLLLFTIVFCVPVATGSTLGLFTHIRDRRRMTVAFARGRAESIIRLPVRVEPWPTLPEHAA